MMKHAQSQLPADRRSEMDKAGRLAWLSIAWLISTIVLLGCVMAGSEAVKTELVGDALSIIPSALFLVGARLGARRPSANYPYGFGRAVSAAYLGASLALLATGVYLLADAVSALVKLEHPTFGAFTIFGHTVWQGWLALPALAWGGIPAIFLGRAKTKLAERLNDKVLAADGRSSSADWKSAGAAIVGVIGIAFGLWWMDAVAAIFISFDILSDGLSDVRSALADLMNRRPQSLKEETTDPLPATLTRFLKSQDWVEDAVVRLREEGRYFVGEAFVAVRDGINPLDRIDQTSAAIKAMDWRLADVVIAPVRQIPDEVLKVRPA